MANLLLGEIAEMMIRTVQGAMKSIDSRFEPSMVEWLIPQIRSEIAIDMYNGTRNRASNTLIPSQFYQTIELVKDKSIQTSDSYIIFPHPQVIRFSDTANGFLYVGKEDGSRSFTQLRSYEHISILTGKGYMTPGEIYYLHDGLNLKVFNNNVLKRMTTRSILSDPLDHPTFDPDVDEYPIPRDLLPDMMTRAVQRFMIPAENSIPDNIRNENNVLTNRTR